MKPVTIYGIPNCDTMKKARTWLEGHGVAYAFNDYKKAGIDRARLEAWSRKVGWETLLWVPRAVLNSLVWVPAAIIDTVRSAPATSGIIALGVLLMVVSRLIGRRRGQGGG